MESMAVWVGGWPSSTKEKSDVVALLAENGVVGAEVTEFRRKVYGDSRGEGCNEDERKRKRKRESSFAFAVLRFESGRHAAESARKVLEGLGLKVRDLKGKLGRKRKRKGGSDGSDGNRGGGGGGGGRSEGGSCCGKASETLSPGEDPPLIEQLRPLSAQELAERLERLMEGGDHRGNEDKEALLDRLAAALKKRGGRRKRRVRCGRDVPPALVRDLEAALRRFPWPAKRRRKSLVSDAYCVLPRGKSQCKSRAPGAPTVSTVASTMMASASAARESGGGGESSADTRDQTSTTGAFLELCEELMRYATGGEGEGEGEGDQPTSFPWSHVAVTLNFQGSPHVDREDRSHQYALSLGDFSAGGELCVDSFGAESKSKAAAKRGVEGGEGADLPEVLICDTRRRLQRVDGRFTHW